MNQSHPPGSLGTLHPVELATATAAAAAVRRPALVLSLATCATLGGGRWWALLCSTTSRCSGSAGSGLLIASGGASGGRALARAGALERRGCHLSQHTRLRARCNVKRALGWRELWGHADAGTGSGAPAAVPALHSRAEHISRGQLFPAPQAPLQQRAHEQGPAVSSGAEHSHGSASCRSPQAGPKGPKVHRCCRL